MMGFLLKLKKLDVRFIKRTLMQREFQKMGQARLDQMNFLMIQSQSRMEQEQKDMGTLLSTFTENIVDYQQDLRTIMLFQKKDETKKRLQ